MKFLRWITQSWLTLGVTATTAVGVVWLLAHKPAMNATDKSHTPATVNKIVKEEDLNTITLSEEAEKRIGLTVAPIEKKPLRRVRVYGGEVAVPIGRTVLVAAPLTGVLKVPPSGEVRGGQTVKARQAVFQLMPLLTPDGRATLSASLADTEGQVNNAKTQVQLTTIALDRAKRVFKEGAGSQRQVDEADAAHNLAIKTLDAVMARQAILNKVVGDAESGTAAPIVIEAPGDGLIRTISALPGQTVPSGAALFEVIDISTIWIRVPLPVGDLDAIDSTMPAQIGKLSASSGTKLQTAQPVSAPPSANPISATVDVFYEMPNPDGKFIPGQRVGVSVPLADGATNLTVPWAAVVFDIHGGTWVFEQLGEYRYARRRVVIGHSVGADAVLAGGPAMGTNVVTAGAQELFGAETGFVK